MAKGDKDEKEKRVVTLEEEFKLIKGELKKTLSTVRDYLLDTGLPDSEYASILSAIGGGSFSNRFSNLLANCSSSFNRSSIFFLATSKKSKYNSLYSLAISLKIFFAS